MGKQGDGPAQTAKWLLLVAAVIAVGDVVPMLWGHSTWAESRHALWVGVPVPVAAAVVQKLVALWRGRKAAVTAASEPDGE